MALDQPSKIAAASAVVGPSKLSRTVSRSASRNSTAYTVGEAASATVSKSTRRSVPESFAAVLSLPMVIPRSAKAVR